MLIVPLPPVAALFVAAAIFFVSRWMRDPRASPSPPSFVPFHRLLARVDDPDVDRRRRHALYATVACVLFGWLLVLLNETGPF